NLDGLSRIVPQLMIGPQGGSVQGGNISLRGIAGPDSNPFGDQAVSFTIDGVQVAKATVRRMSDFDIAQVEVLKGPQALFYGKNSMGGIVNIRTNDPGDHLEVGGKIGYEFQAREVRGEGYVSTPLGEGLGLRIAGQFSDMQGYLKDQTPSNSPYFNTERNPNVTDWGIRATLKYEAGDTFDARLKFNYGSIRGNGPASTTEFVYCPSGSRQFAALGAIGDNSQCGAGDLNVNAGYGAAVAKIPTTRNNNFRADGKNFNNQDQYLTSLVMNFRPSDKLTITSATGYYRVKYDACQNYENSYAILLPSCNVYRNRELSQELNFNTDLDGPLNFTGGLYYSDVKAGTGSLTYLFGGAFPLLAPPGTPGLPNGLGGPTTPALVNYYWFEMKGTAWSAFLEGTFKLTDQLELSGGVRYSKEKKRLPVVLDGGGVASGAQNPFLLNLLGIPGVTTDLIPVKVGSANALGASLLKDHDSWDDWSPEVTLSYRPNSDLTLFASYKHGFLSGSFNSSSVNLAAPNVDLSYKPQTIRGGEVGVKARVGGVLLLNAAAYTYRVSDLQVVNFTNATSSIRNAAKAKIEGFEADFTWRAPVQGLTINGAMAYNDSKYQNFPGAPCYNGESAAEGCVAGTQQLGGQVVPRSPKWNLQGGFNYETAVGSGLKLGMSGGVNHSSAYLTDASNAPGSLQKAYTMVDGTLRLGAENDGWQVSLIGRNLTNKFVFFAAPDVPFSGANAFGVRLGDRFGSVSRGREILLQVGFKFGQ
ncbi:MAG: TonB-dependent receptor, partial [Sphingomonadales bacterium]|nr:TonB-dependent receptor [Sphingomonadales bacterium]